MKKDYQDVKFIRERSGFGWDAERSVATATDDVWEKLFEVYDPFFCLLSCSHLLSTEKAKAEEVEKEELSTI